MANLMKQTEEQHSESRMRKPKHNADRLPEGSPQSEVQPSQIRKFGSMWGREVGGHWPCASHPVTSFPTLPFFHRLLL